MPKNDGFWHFAEKSERWPSLFLADLDSALNSGTRQQVSEFLKALLVFVYSAWKEITLKNVSFCGSFVDLIRLRCAFFCFEAKIKPNITAQTDNHRSRRDLFRDASFFGFQNLKKCLVANGLTFNFVIFFEIQQKLNQKHVTKPRKKYFPWKKSNFLARAAVNWLQNPSLKPEKADL